ncbi:MAG TPA: TIR domain-containing protein [Thermoanaerobaculia bacterium]
MAKILLADNDAKSLQAWSTALEDEGYDVTRASSVAEAQDHLVRGGFDLAVLDLHMESDDEADDSGLRLARAFRDNLPIVMYTGKPTTDLAIKALQRDGRSSPAVAFVRKLEDGLEGLLKAVQQAIVPKVFVAHGHDDEATEAVVSFLRRSGVQAVVLKEQPLASQTIIQAFEEQSNVQFAIILLTPDDEGRLKGKKPWEPRARQNVVFELGFFLAKLGRHRVVAFMKEGEPVEVPSNYSGFLYQELDRWGKWQEKLTAIMKAAGIELR